LFNSKPSLYFSLFIILANVSYLFFTHSNLEELKLSSHTIFVIPLEVNDLALKLDGECLGHLKIKQKLGTILNISGSIDKADTSLAIFNAYFNILGQLLKVDLNYQQKDYLLEGVKELSLSYDDVEKKFRGPVNIVIEDSKLKIIYRYLEKEFIDRIELIKLKDCHA